jgi:guanine deaminase
MSRVYHGALVNPIDPASLDLLPDALVAITEDGLVAWIEPNVESSQVQELLALHAWADVPVIVLSPDEWLMPGFVDTHTASALFHDQSSPIQSNWS